MNNGQRELLTILVVLRVYFCKGSINIALIFMYGLKIWRNQLAVSKENTRYLLLDFVSNQEEELSVVLVCIKKLRCTFGYRHCFHQTEILQNIRSYIYRCTYTYFLTQVVCLSDVVKYVMLKALPALHVPYGVVEFLCVCVCNHVPLFACMCLPIVTREACETAQQTF